MVRAARLRARVGPHRRHDRRSAARDLRLGRRAHPLNPPAMAERLTNRRPDDWHLHVRDGAMLKATLPFSANHFGRGIIMPNLVPPVRTVADAAAYRARLLAALPEGSRFTPLMTCYMTDDTDPDEVERGFRDGVFTAVKIYP